MRIAGEAPISSAVAANPVPAFVLRSVVAITGRNSRWRFILMVPAEVKADAGAAISVLVCLL